MEASSQLPAIRACIFDVDGLLINSEDIYTEIYNNILHEFGAPDYPWKIKATQQSRGRPGTLRLLEWAKIPLSLEQWNENVASQEQLFSKSKILPGVADLLRKFANSESPHICIALASSAGRKLFDIKTGHIPELRDAFADECRVFGDDPEMVGREGKPSPDIFLLAMSRLNKRFEANGESVVKPQECLVFEDSIAGVEAGRRAGMQVVWIPHPGLAKVCRGREQEVLMGKIEENGTPSFPDEDYEHDTPPYEKVLSHDRLARMIPSLEGFPYEEYCIKVQE